MNTETAVTGHSVRALIINIFIVVIVIMIVIITVIVHTSEFRGGENSCFRLRCATKCCRTVVLTDVSKEHPFLPYVGNGMEVLRPLE